MLDIDPRSVCRDEECDLVDLHVRHDVKPGKRRGRQRRSTSPKQPWRRDDPEGLTEAVLKATSEAYPTHHAAIVREVRDDYGSVTERTIYRYLAKLSRQGALVKLNLGLTFAAYIKPTSRLLNDKPALRDYMLGLLELHPATKVMTW